MVYKRYIYRNGKRFGPYYYHTYRDKDGRTHSRYVPEKTEESRAVIPQQSRKNIFQKYPALFLLSGAIIFILILVSFLNYQYSGQSDSEKTFSLKSISEGVYSFITGFTSEGSETSSITESSDSSGDVSSDEGSGASETADTSAETTEETIPSDTTTEETPNETTSSPEGQETTGTAEETDDNETSDEIPVENETVTEEQVNETISEDNETIVEQGNETEINVTPNETATNETFGPEPEGEVAGGVVNVTNKTISLDNFTAEANVTNETIVNSTTNVTTQISTQQFGAVLGKPVRWEKKVKVFVEGADSISGLVVDLPKDAGNVSVKKISDKGEEEIEFNVEGENITEEVESNVELAEKEQNGNLVTGVFNFILGIFRFTGRVVENPNEEVTVEIPSEIKNQEEVILEYYTDAPYAVEQTLQNGKMVKVVGSEEVHYENVLAFTELDEDLNLRNPKNVRIYWVEGGINVPVELVDDLNSNGIYDYIEWIAPQLSNQTFEIIVITKAEHLDSNRTFVSDIYDEVKELDGNWSEPIFEGEYVRVTFERNLTSENDITIYPRVVNGTPRIEIYEKDSGSVTAEFETIKDNEYNKVFLTNLNGTQDTFDLRILDGVVEFDHIIDPSACGAGSCYFDDSYVLADIRICEAEDIDTGGCAFPTDTGVQVMFNIQDLCNTNPTSIDTALLQFYIGTKAGTPDGDANLSFVNDTSWTESSSASTINSQIIRNITTTESFTSTTVSTYTNISVLTQVREACLQEYNNVSIRLTDIDFPISSIIIVEDSTSVINFGRTGVSQPNLGFRPREYTTSAQRPSLFVTYSGGNIAPEHNTPNISPFPTALNSENLTCTNQSTSDADGDGVTNVYNWLVDDNSATLLYLPFETDTNSTTKDLIRDYSGKGNNGTLNTTNVTWTSAGKIGGAYKFNRTTASFIEVDDSTSVRVTGNVTFMAWIKPSTTIGVGSGDRTILVKKISSEGNANYYFLIKSSDGKLNLYFNNTYQAGTQNSWTADTWYHVAATYNGTYVVLYVNGSVDNTVAKSGTFLAYDGFPLRVGAWTATTNQFNGTIDDVRIYNRSLSAAQISQIYQDGVNGWSNSSMIVSDETELNQNWTCQVTPNDAVQDGETKINSTTITASSPPNVTLNSPSNGDAVYDGATFNCSATDDVNLANISLYGNWTGTWHLNQTVNISGTSNGTTFNITLPDAGFVWNCLAYDNDSLSDWGNSNFTLTNDVCGVTQISVDTTLTSNRCEHYNITTDNITFNCNGYHVNGHSGLIGNWTISAYNRTNLTIKDCYFANWSHVILFSNTSNSRIQNSTFFNISDVSIEHVEAISIKINNSGSNNILSAINITNMTTNSTSTSNCYNGKLEAIDLSSATNVTLINSSFSNINGTFREDTAPGEGGCNPPVISTIGDGIFFSSSSNGTVFNSTFNTIGKVAIKASSSNYGNYTSNTITKSETGISTTNDANGGTAKDNIINESATGIFVSGSGSWNVTNNNVKYLTSGGIILTQAIGGYVNNNTVMHINSTSSGVGGILMGIQDPNSFTNNTAFNVTYSLESSAALIISRAFNGSGLNITNASDGVITSSASAHGTNLYNSTISQITGNSTSITQSSTNISYYNVTHPHSQISILGSGSNLFNYYYLQVNVTDNNYAALNGAGVNVTNSTGGNTPEIQTATGASGLTSQLTIRTFHQNTTGFTNHTPHNFSATKTGYSLNYTNENITSSRIITLVLHTPSIDAYIPVTDNFSIAEPNNQTFSIVYSNVTPVAIRWFVNDTEQTDSVNSSQFIWVGNYSQQGVYRIKVNITNEGYDEQVWIMTVNDTNAIPNHTAPIFSPFPPTFQQNFSCLNQSTSDANGDNVTNVYNWLVDGNSTSVLNMPFNTNISNTSFGYVKDYSGYNNNGTLNSTTNITWIANGKVGGAFNFSGANGFVEMKDSTNLRVTGNVTFMAWIKSTTNLAAGGSDKTILAKKVSPDNNANYYLLIKGSDGKLNLYFNNTYQAGTQSSWINNTWYHVAATYNGTYVTLYVNGSMDNVVSKSGTFIAYDSFPLRIGAWANDTNLFNGTIDDVRIYNRSLSASQIYQIYQDGVNGWSNSSTIVSDETILGENWTCQVTPNDAVQDGPTLSNSTNITDVSIALELSTRLGQQINWTLNTLPAFNQSALGNNGSEITEYYVNVSVTGGSADLYIRAEDDLRTSGGDILAVGNETYSYNYTNSSVPSDNKTSLTKNYSDNPLASSLSGNSVIYLKFFLNAPASQPAGTYNNTISFKAVGSGQTP